MAQIIRTYMFIDSASVTHKVRLVKVGKQYEVRVNGKKCEVAETPQQAREKFEATIKTLKDLKTTIEKTEA